MEKLVMELARNVLINIIQNFINPRPPLSASHNALSKKTAWRERDNGRVSDMGGYNPNEGR